MDNLTKIFASVFAAFFTAIMLTLTSVASATEVSSVMTDTRHKFYINSDNIAKVYFEITAKRFIEDYSQIKHKSYFLFSRFKSSKVTQFQQGTLYLKDSNLTFKQASWSQGKLVLTGVSGVINQQKFNSPEVTFNKKSMLLMAKNITLINENKISRKLSFRQNVSALN